MADEIEGDIWLGDSGMPSTVMTAGFTAVTEGVWLVGIGGGGDRTGDVVGASLDDFGLSAHC